MKQDENGVWWFRQSWFGDFMLCPERSRLKAFLERPTDLDGTDATTFGTALHLAIEEFLKGASPEQAHAAAEAWLIDQWQQGTFKVVSIKNASTHQAYLRACFAAWLDQVFPQLMNADPDRGIEHTFKHQVTDRWGIEGTWDYMDEFGTLWDWKSAGSNFQLQYGPKALSKKHQPTFYTLAKAGWTAGESHNEDHLFIYGIMVKGRTPRAELRHVTRNVTHWEWLVTQIDAILYMYNSIGPIAKWPLHDNEWHCSEDWCEEWDRCKGSIVSVNL